MTNHETDCEATSPWAVRIWFAMVMVAVDGALVLTLAGQSVAGPH